MKPILFSTDMVKAILEGRKTQTRRLIKPQPTNPRWNNIGWVGFDDGHGNKMPYRLGDMLYVRETWAKIEDFKNYADMEIPRNLKFLYKCDDTGKEHTFVDVGVQKWRPSIHMPREAARIFLKVTDVRVERLQDIRGSDVINEGVCEAYEEYENLIPIFKDLWNSIYKNWDENPWVWVIEFQRCENTTT